MEHEKSSAPTTGQVDEMITQLRLSEASVAVGTDASALVPRKNQQRGLLPGKNGYARGQPAGYGEMRTACRQFTYESIAKFVHLMRNGETQHIQLLAAEQLLNRGWGKPAQEVMVGGTVTVQHEHRLRELEQLEDEPSGSGAEAVAEEQLRPLLEQVLEDTVQGGEDNPLQDEHGTEVHPPEA